MHRFVATRRPASALLHAQRMIGTTNQKLTVARCLEMAFQARIRITHREQFCVNRAMGFVATGASLPHGFMFEGKRTALSGVAPNAGIVLRHERCPAPHVSRTFVGRMAVAASDSPFRQWVMTRETKLTAHLEMTLKTEIFRLAPRAYRLARGETGALRTAGSKTKGRFDLAARLRVQAGGAMARFAANVHRVGPLCDQSRVIRRTKVAVNLSMTLFALFGADVGRAGDIR